MLLTKRFFNKKTEQVAKNLLGCYLLSKNHEGITIGKIVETEAYLYDDEASHSYNGETKRNSPMFQSPGSSYVYFTYGMYNCFNIVTAKKGIGEAVLIRALEPIKGIELMKQRRKNSDVYNLCNGPAKLVIAMGINKEHNGINLLENTSPLKLLSRKHFSHKNKNFDIVASKRIGIKKAADLKLRFYIKDNGFVSRK